MTDSRSPTGRSLAAATWKAPSRYRPAVSSESSPVRRLGQFLGLIYADEGEPRSGSSRRSRYERGPFVSPRLDQDVDDILARLSEVERKLGK